MTKYKKIAFIFPGQGAQYPGMGRDFVDSFPVAKQTLEEADEILGRKMSTIILQGPEEVLTETKNSQTAIFITGMALFNVLKSVFPHLQPQVCAGLSLGEYTALTAAQILTFQEALPLVQTRGQCMNDACEETRGTMAVILGLDATAVEQLVKEVNLPHDLWVANFNCPGQVVISGTLKGVEAGSAAAKVKGAKRVLPLQVHGAFHSGLMRRAEERLAEAVANVSLDTGIAEVVMNVPGNFVVDAAAIRRNLIEQVTHSVRWEQGIRAMNESGVDLFIEFGPGKTLSGMNRKIGVTAPTFSLEKIEDLDFLSKELA